jgi:hypothetical protein
MQLTTKDKGVLLLCARESIATLFSGNPEPSIDFYHFPNLQEPCGAFVTLLMGEDLRGCIGYMQSEEPLYHTVCEVAKLAASEDPRFAPLAQNELPYIRIEISVLSPMEPLTDYNNIIIGTHGLLVDEPDGRGVLLPQVAVENNMSVSQFLTALCQKANLPPTIWMKRKLNILTFTADVFSEQVHRNLTGER